ncbi:hypothetical protein HHE03_00480 [Helicobacter heilmannii]|nr:hypothetical protein HHE03_00480 [Helicobacter heilmannii]
MAAPRNLKTYKNLQRIIGFYRVYLAVSSPFLFFHFPLKWG